VKRYLRTELLVMQGLLEDGTRSDRDISERFGLKTGTVASARRRLVKSGAVTFSNIPAFNLLGCEMLGFHVGVADLTVAPEKRVGHYADFCNLNPQVFLGILGGNSAVFYTALRNATENESFLQSHYRFFSGKMRGPRTRLQSHLFPYPLSWGTYCFNFAPIIRAYYDIDGPEPVVRIPTNEELEEPDFNGSEAKTYVAFVEKPWLTDEAVSKVAGVSRQAVTSMRHKFVEKGLMCPTWIPDFRVWGFEMFASIHSHVVEEIPWEKVTSRTEPKDALHLSFLTLGKGNEIVGNYAHPGFEQYSQLSEKAMGVFERLSILEEKPHVILFSLATARFLRYFEFGPAVRRLLLG